MAYVAGIIDGEGSICIAKKHKRARRGEKQWDFYIYILLVAVGNTNEWLIRWLQFNFGGWVNEKDNSARYLSKKRLFVWSIEAAKAADFLQLILPYLRLKKPQAELAIQFQRRKRRGVRPKGVKILEEAEAILMSKYNDNRRLKTKASREAWKNVQTTA